MQFRVRPVGDGVYEVQEVETGEIYKIDVNTMQTTKPLDELTLAALMQALSDFGIVQGDDGSYGATDRGAESGTPQRTTAPLSGKDAWNAQFGSNSPSGFHSSGRFGTASVGSKGVPSWVSTVGGSWGSSPSGWNAPGGWSADPGPSSLWQLMQQGYSRDDAFRIIGGMQPLGALQQQVQDTSNLMQQNYYNQSPAGQGGVAQPGTAQPVSQSSHLPRDWANRLAGVLGK